MQKAAQNSQLKNGNLGGGRVYAFRVSRINADYVCLKLWLLGGIIRARNIAVAALPALVEQIDAALADGCERIALDGAEFSAPEKVLLGIRNEFSSYCCTGASDANHVPVKPPRIAAAESVKKCGAKTKASAPQGSASAARQIYNEERKTKNELRHLHTRRKNNTNCFGVALQPSTPAGVAADVSAIRADLDEMRESQEDFFENLAELLLRVAEVLNDGGDAKPKQPRGWQKCAVENPLGAAIRTKRGRTSVVVGVRKIAKFQPKTKGKSK